MKEFVLRRLETALRVWEQTLFVANAETRVKNPDACTGAIKNWHLMRKAVLNRTKPFESENFQVPLRMFGAYFIGNLMYDYLPTMFANWSRTSRRAYALTPDLQTDLELTSISKVTWNDLNPPFPCFAITLPVPIPGLFNNLIDTLVVEMRQKGVIRITTFGNEMDVFKRMPDQMRNGIASAARNHNLGKLVARCEQARARNYCFIPANQNLELISGSSHWHEEILPDQIRLDDVQFISMKNADDEAKAREMRFWLPLCRIIVGLCLHLDRLQDGNLDEPPIRLEVDKSDMPATEDLSAITTAEELFTVHCGHPLTDEERRIHKIIRKLGSADALRELGAHFRSAHWRRPPNTARSPCSRKTVKVRWTIVNEERLGDVGLPSGSLVQVG